MSSLIVVTYRGSSLGFKCAGVDTAEVKDGAEFAGLVRRLAAEGRYSLVAAEERLISTLPDEILKRIKRKGLPVMIPVNIPDRWGAFEEGESPAVRLIRKAIGYQIRIKR